MESAFGVDHGDISKALGGARKAQKAAMQARKLAQRDAGRAAGSAVRRGPGKLKAMSTKAVNAEISIARVGGGLGRGINTTGQKVGETIQRYPGAAGTAVVGGAGYGLYRSGRKNKESK